MQQDEIFYVITFDEMRASLDSLERQALESLVAKMYRSRIERTQRKTDEPRHADVHR